MTCQLSFFYQTNLGDSGNVSFVVPDGSYVSAYVNWMGSSYDVRSDGSQGTIILTGPFNPPAGFSVSYSNFANSCPPVSIEYDCVNGACVKKTKFSTPGFYKSLSDCETACGTGCSGKCLSNADWNQIKGLANKLKSRNCK